jgi:hypothetical protein
LTPTEKYHWKWAAEAVHQEQVHDEALETINLDLNLSAVDPRLKRMLLKELGTEADHRLSLRELHMRRLSTRGSSASKAKPGKGKESSM